MTISEKIEFIQNHKPPLTAGDYSLTVEQTLGDAGDKIPRTNGSDPSYSLTKTFTVSGERFTLNSGDITARFPPNQSVANYSNTLPHILLGRSTLPWERQALLGNADIPWLVLLLLDEDDKQSIEENTVSLSELVTGAENSSPYFPPLTLETGQQTTDQANVIDIPSDLLSALLASADEQSLLTHVRVALDSDDAIIGQESAVIMGNRLPTPGKINFVYLVSLEHRLQDNGGTIEFDYQNADTTTTTTDTTRLVSLASWSFTAAEHYKVREVVLAKNSLSFSDDATATAMTTALQTLVEQDFYTTTDFIQAIEGAGVTASQLAATDADNLSNQDKLLAAFAYGDFAALLKNIDHTPGTLRLPVHSDTTAEDFVQTGLTARSHALRAGGSTVSWYRGPLVASQSTVSLSLPVATGEQLIRYYATQGMFDLTYSAAWSLGRLLALQNKSFARTLYQWKRTYRQKIHKESQAGTSNSDHASTHLPKTQITRNHVKALAVPDSVTQWFSDLALLKGVPFNYLVCDEALLPVESLRFFTVDNGWIEAIIDGAFSIGRVTETDHTQDDQLYSALNNALGSLPVRSGFLLRSEVVSGFPGLQVQAFDSSDQELTVVRQETLSENVLLCLFADSIERLELHLPPEILHFGLTWDDTNTQYIKELRDTSGETLSDSVTAILTDKNKLDITGTEGLKTAIDDKYLTNPNIEWQATATAAEFAVQMVEGVEKVQFNRSAAS